MLPNKRDFLIVANILTVRSSGMGLLLQKSLCEECEGDVVETVKVERKVIVKAKAAPKKAPAKKEPKKATAAAAEKTHKIATPKKKAPRGRWVDMSALEEHKRIKKLIREAVKEPKLPKGRATSSAGQPQSAADLPLVCEPSGSARKRGRLAAAAKRPAPKTAPAQQATSKKRK